MPVIALGESIPVQTPHAASVSLPTWRDNIGYEEGDLRVVTKMTTGYPRFFIHRIILALAKDVVIKYGSQGQRALPFHSSKAARRCVDFMLSRESSIVRDQISIVDLVLDLTQPTSDLLRGLCPSIHAVLFPEDLFAFAKQYWQHTGEGVSSRQAEFCHTLLQEGLLVKQTALQSSTNGANAFQKTYKGPKRYQKASIDETPPISQISMRLPGSHDTGVANGTAETRESTQFLEERFGRNLDISFATNAKSAICRRIVGAVLGEVDLSTTPRPMSASNMRGVTGLSEDDVYLFPCGMNAIYHTHRMMLEARGPLKSISFGFPYCDTLKVLEKFGPGVVFYGNGSSKDLDDLESRLKGGERFLALFCEFPGNPMLRSPDLHRIRRLADTYDFGLVVDETIGNFINVRVLPCADVVVSSLSKIFSGECNVLGGGAIFNPEGRYYQQLKKVAEFEYEDHYWPEDVVFMERNSRHFATRIVEINHSAEAICEVLRASPVVTNLYYPKYNDDRSSYDACRTPNGGYGGLLSFTCHNKAQAIAFFDRIETAKGPSLGTNFTLTSPYVILAHYFELEWAAQFGVPEDLLRISVGLEDPEELKSIVAVALKAAAEVS